MTEKPAYTRSLDGEGDLREEWTMTGGPYAANIRLTHIRDTKRGDTWVSRFAFPLPTREAALRTAVARLIRSVRRQPQTERHKKQAVIDWALGVAGKDIPMHAPPAPRPTAPPPLLTQQTPRCAVHDDACRALTAQMPTTIVPWLLMSGYAYHHLDRPILSDSAWDTLCREATALWPTLMHPHKHLITVEDLKCSSLFALPRSSYPAIAVSAAERILREGVVQAPSAPAQPRQAERIPRCKPARRPIKPISAGDQLSLF